VPNNSIKKLSWGEVGADELAHATTSLAVQQADEMQEELPLRCFFLKKSSEASLCAMD